MPAHKLTPVQLFYIEHHYEKVSAEDLAAALELTVALVKGAIRKIKAERKKSDDALAAVKAAESAPAPAAPTVPLHEPRDGRTVAMTEAGSHAGDEAMKRVRQGSNNPRYAACISKIDPSKPSQ